MSIETVAIKLLTNANFSQIINKKKKKQVEKYSEHTTKGYASLSVCLKYLSTET